MWMWAANTRNQTVIEKQCTKCVWKNYNYFRTIVIFLNVNSQFHPVVQSNVLPGYIGVLIRKLYYCVRAHSIFSGQERFCNDSIWVPILFQMNIERINTFQIDSNRFQNNSKDYAGIAVLPLTRTYAFIV